MSETIIMPARMLCPSCHGSKLEAGGFTCLYCNGLGNIEDSALAPHFFMHEFLGAPHYVDPADGKLKMWDGKSYLAPGISLIPNVPHIEHVERGRMLAQQLLEPGRAGLGTAFNTHSWFRCQNPLDFLVAGAPFDKQLSAHAIGSAIDITPASPGIKFKDVMEWYLGHSYDWDQLIIEGGCIHAALEAPYPVKPPGMGQQRRMAMVRLMGPVGKFIYAKYDGSDSQLAEVR
jgi:hypothetical protein